MEAVLAWAFETNQSLFTILFIALLGATIGFIKWVLKKNDERETRYINVIDTQAEALRNVDGMKNDISDIKTYLFRKGGMG